MWPAPHPHSLHIKIQINSTLSSPLEYSTYPLHGWRMGTGCHTLDMVGWPLECWVWKGIPSRHTPLGPVLQVGSTEPLIFPGSQVWGYSQDSPQGQSHGDNNHLVWLVCLPLSSCPRCCPEALVGLRSAGSKMKRRQGSSPLPVPWIDLLQQPVSGHRGHPQPMGEICGKVSMWPLTSTLKMPSFHLRHCHQERTPLTEDPVSATGHSEPSLRKWYLIEPTTAISRGRSYLLILHFIGEATEAQKSQVTFPRPHSR